MCFTFNGAPFRFPSQNPFPVHLVLLVTAHHSKRDHLLLSAHMQTHTFIFRSCIDYSTLLGQNPIIDCFEEKLHGAKI